MSVKADVNANIEFAAGAERTFSDPRIVEVLNTLAADHKLTVSGSSDGGVDISAIDGRPVGVANFDAREVAMRLQYLDPSIRPDEIGTPWAIDGPGYFTDTGHQDVLHIGFDEHPSMPPMAVAVAAAPSGPVDPAQFGAEGTGGTPSAETQALLQNHNIVFDSTGIGDLKAGRIDPRVVAVLTKLSDGHSLTISAMASGHSKFTTGGSVSNHFAGRGVDIAAIDGVPVDASNFDAREMAMKLRDLDPSIRPDEIGTPWAIIGPSYFTDGAHQHHLHIGFDHEISPDFKPPSDIAASAETARSSRTMSVPAPVAKTADVGHESLSFMAAVEPRRQGGAAADAAAQLAAGANGGAVGAKALAAVAEAEKYLGTPYQWGGSTPQTHFDCSGLVQWAYAQAGISIPRVTEQQILAGTPVVRDHLLPGDLVFFHGPSGYVHHVGMSLGGDTFIHAPHTGDVVKISSLDEPYYKEQFTGGRRFDAAGSAPDATEVATAHARVARDAAEVRRRDSALFVAVRAQEAAKAHMTVRFLEAVDPDQARPAAPGVLSQAPLDLGGAAGYPGDAASQAELAKWLARQAQDAGLPPELPIMASLVESGVRKQPQAERFIDQALELKRRRVAAGDVNFGKDPSKWGEWIADVLNAASPRRRR